MVAPVINDGSPVHGYNLFKYHTSSASSTLLSATSGTALTNLTSYNYASGTANDGLLVFYDCFAWNDNALTGVKGEINVRQSGAGVTNTVLGSIYIDSTTGGQGDPNYGTQCLQIGSVNQDFTLFLDAKVPDVNCTVSNRLWSVISF